MEALDSAEISPPSLNRCGRTVKANRFRTGNCFSISTSMKERSWLSYRVPRSKLASWRAGRRSGEERLKKNRAKQNARDKEWREEQEQIEKIARKQKATRRAKKITRSEVGGRGSLNSIKGKRTS